MSAVLLTNAQYDFIRTMSEMAQYCVGQSRRYID